MKSATIFLILFSINSFSQSYFNIHLLNGSYKNVAIGDINKITFNFTSSTLDFHMSTGNILSEAISDINSFSLSNVPLGVPLPVELISFTAIVKDKFILLQWKTQTEVNNYGFDIERSTDNSRWEKIGFVNGNNNSNSPNEYFFEYHPTGGNKFYFRLKQIDIDGETTYSNVICVDLTVPSQYHLFQNYPNPFNPKTTISYNLPRDGNVSIKIYDILGNEVFTLINEYQKSGIYTIQFNGSELSSGIYFCKMTGVNFISLIKMTLLK